MVNVTSLLSRTAELANPRGPLHFYPGVAYPASKATVNIVTVQYAKAFPGIRINAAGGTVAGADRGVGHRAPAR